MNSRKIHVLIFILGVTTLLVQSIVLHRRNTKVGEATRDSVSGGAAPENAGDASVERRPDANSEPAKSGPIPEYVAMTPPQRWRALVNVTFRLIDPKSLELKEVVGELLELNPEQTKELQSALSKLLDDVRVEEVRNAYVRVKSDGSQEVMVAPFDRRPLLQKFRDSLVAKLGADIGDFCAREALYDDTLAVGNKEVRIYTERGMRIAALVMPENQRREFAEMAERMKNQEKLVVSRGVHRRNSTGRPDWEGEAAPPAVSTLSHSTDYGPRYRHLQEAISRLPRKTQ